MDPPAPPNGQMDPNNQPLDAAADRAQRQAERERIRLATEVQHLQEQLRIERDRARQPNMLQAAAAAGGMLPKFSGDPSRGETITSFLQDYQLACDSVGMNDEMAALALGRSLEGHAKQKYKEIIAEEPRIRGDLRALSRRLEEYFHQLGGGPRYGSVAFYSRKQLPGESPTTYFAELKRLGKQAYPDDQEPMPDSVLLERFIRGLPLYLKRHVITREPRNSEEALREAVRVQAQRDFLAEDEDGPTIAAVKVQEDMQDQIKKLTLQVSQLTTQLTDNRKPEERWNKQWPRPEHHFPSSNQRPNFRRNRRPKMQNYNRAAEQRCWNCGKFGHFQATCRVKPRRNNSHRVNEVVAEEQERTTATSGGSKATQAYLCLAVICVLLPTTVDAQRAMICQTASPGHLFSLPRPVECTFNSTAAYGTPVPMTLELYKHNLFKYDVPGWLCRGVRQTARLLTYFFGDEHLKEFNSQDVEVSTSMCHDMLRNRRTPHGKLTQKTTGLWSTDNKLNWKTPSWGLPECCQWHHYEAINYFLIPARVYKRHDIAGFESSAADVSKCPTYYSGECQLGKKALIWEPSLQAKCKYIKYQVLNGTWMMNAWISQDGMLALTHQSQTKDIDCNVKLNISDQQIPFRILSPTTGQNRFKRNNNPIVKQGNGAVMSDQLAAKLEVLYLRTRKEIDHAF